MTVAMTVATVVTRAVRKVKIMIGNEAQRVYTERGTMKIITKVRHAPVRNSANIHSETTRIR